MRILFRQNNYKTFLVDEFRTSCMCSICKTELGRCEKFQIRKNPKPYKSNNILVHGQYVVRTVKLYGIEM